MSKDGYKFEPDVIDLRQIDEIVKKIDRYGKRDEFIRESLELMILWWTSPMAVQKKSMEMWKDYTTEMKEEVKEMAPEFYERMEEANKGIQNNKKIGENFLSELKEDIKKSRKLLTSEDIPSVEEYIPNNNPPLMNKLHTRIFPSKLVLSILANTIKEKIETEGSRWINYEEFRTNCFQQILEVSKILKMYEGEGKGRQRNERVSTGLPSFHEKTFENKDEELNNLNKIKSSKERFLEQFVGPTIRSWKQGGVIGGILNDLGLVYFVKNENGTLDITLSKLGLEFFKKENPILDEQDFTYSISKKERDFIQDNLIPRFDLEKRIVDGIMNKINKLSKDKLLSTDDIDTIVDAIQAKWFTEKKNENVGKEMNIKRGDEKYWQNIRIAIMGRLSEIGAVEWIIKEKLSKYKGIETQKITVTNSK
jgi:hypothetical protein